jgi:hypothetical protein
MSMYSTVAPIRVGSFKSKYKARLAHIHRRPKAVFLYGYTKKHRTIEGQNQTGPFQFSSIGSLVLDLGLERTPYSASASESWPLASIAGGSLHDFSLAWSRVRSLEIIINLLRTLS